MRKPNYHQKAEIVELFNLKFNNAALVTAAEDVVQLATVRKKGLILPVNVDQIVKISVCRNIKNIYDSALRIYADGMPIVWLSKIIGNSLQERVTGSDLVPEICQRSVEHDLRIFLFGAAPGVAAAAATNLTEKYPGLNIVGTYSPPFGFEHDNNEIERAINKINSTTPDILFLALGFPKQELFAADNIDRLDVGPIVSIGATLDFIAGNVKRAPRIFRDNGFEWLWRLMQEPRRLWYRYLVGGPRFILLAFSEILKKDNN